MEYKKKIEIEFIPFIYNQICYGMILFIFYIFSCGIDGTSIQLHTVKYRLME